MNIMIKNIPGSLKIVSIFILPVFLIIGCATAHVAKDQQADQEAWKQSVDQTVSEFLEALKNKDYQKAYDYVFMPQMDKAEYVSSLESAQDQNQSSILGYKIVETRIFTRSAVVDAEVDMSYKKAGSGEMVQIKRINRYELTKTKGWNITGEECVSNCGN